MKWREPVPSVGVCAVVDDDLCDFRVWVREREGEPWVEFRLRVAEGAEIAIVAEARFVRRVH